jgi:hypothetical protein
MSQTSPKAPKKSKPIFKRTPVIVTLITTAGLIIVAIIGKLSWPAPSSTPTPVGTTSLNSTTPTAIAQTPIITVNPDPTVSPSPSPQLLLTRYEAIKPVYKDHLNNRSDPNTVQEGWDTAPTTNTASNGQPFTANCAFTTSGYEVSVSHANPQENNPSWCVANPPQTYTNVLIEVQMEIKSGSAGLLFRDQSYKTSGKWSYYYFQINPDAHPLPQFSLTVNPPDNKALKAPTSFSPQSGGGTAHTYTLQVIAQGSNLYLFIDRSFVAQIQDTTYLKGNIGFACYNNIGGNSCDALFRDVSVRNLPSA